MASSSRPVSRLEEIQSLVKKEDIGAAIDKVAAVLREHPRKSELQGILFHLVSSKDTKTAIAGYVDFIKKNFQSDEKSAKDNPLRPRVFSNLEAIFIFLQLALEAKNYSLALRIANVYSSLLVWSEDSACTEEGCEMISTEFKKMCDVVKAAKTDDATLNTFVETERVSRDMRDQFRRLAPPDAGYHFADCQRLLSIKLDEKDASYRHKRNMITQQMTSYIQRLDINPDDKTWPEERKAMIDFLLLSHTPSSLENHTSRCLARALIEKADQPNRLPSEMASSRAAVDVLARVSFKQYLESSNRVLLSACLGFLGRETVPDHSFFNDAELQKQCKALKDQPDIQSRYQLLTDRMVALSSVDMDSSAREQAASRGCIYELVDKIKYYAPDFKYSEDHQSKLLPLFLILWLELKLRQFGMTNKAMMEYLTQEAKNYIFSHQQKYPAFANWACRIIESKAGVQPHLDDFRNLSAADKMAPMSALIERRFSMEPNHDYQWVEACAVYRSGVQYALNCNGRSAKDVGRTLSIAALASEQAPSTTIFAGLKHQNEQDAKAKHANPAVVNSNHDFGLFGDTYREISSPRSDSSHMHDLKATPRRRHGRSQSF